LVVRRDEDRRAALAEVPLDHLAFALRIGLLFVEDAIRRDERQQRGEIGNRRAAKVHGVFIGLSAGLGSPLGQIASTAAGEI